MRIAIWVLSALFFTAALFTLQFLLSKRPSPWPGRIPPLLCACLSAAVFFSQFALLAGSSFSNALISGLLSLLLFNIPTVLLLGVHLTCRDLRKQALTQDACGEQCG